MGKNKAVLGDSAALPQYDKYILRDWIAAMNRGFECAIAAASA
jgi:hypothetical protein